MTFLLFEIISYYLRELVKSTQNLVENLPQRTPTGHTRGKRSMELKLKLAIYRRLHKDFECEFLEKLAATHFQIPRSRRQKLFSTLVKDTLLLFKRNLLVIYQFSVFERLISSCQFSNYFNQSINPLLV